MSKEPGSHRSAPRGVDNREVRARMDFPTAQLLLERGCDKDILRQLIEQKLREGKDYESATDLMNAYLNATQWAAKSLKPATTGSAYGDGEFRSVHGHRASDLCR